MWEKEIIIEDRELPKGTTKLYFLELEDMKIESEEFARMALRKYTHEYSNEFIIERNKFGKPYLKNNSCLYFNISHTKGIIVCAVSVKPIGVDIEKVKPLNKRIAQKFFTQSEQEYIFTSEDEQDRRFCEIWTRKEAYVKWDGRGMQLPLKSFDVVVDNRISTIFVDNYVISVCS